MGNNSNTYVLRKYQLPRFEVIIDENPLAPLGQEITSTIQPVNPPVARIIETLSGVQVSSQKLFACGDVWELYTFQDVNGHPVQFQYGYSLKGDLPLETQETTEMRRMLSLTERFSLETEETSPPVIHYTDEQKADERQRNRKRTKKLVGRLIRLNKLKYLWTLDFALDLNENVPGLWRVLPEEKQRDRREVQKCWNRFKTVLRKELKEMGIRFKFLKVLEKHDSDKTSDEKRYTYHIHFATDKPIDKYWLQELWGYGVTWYDDYSKQKIVTDSGRHQNIPRDPGDYNDPVGYMTKKIVSYVEKEFDEADSYHERAFSCSQNLKRPKPIRDEQVIAEKLKDSQAERYLTFDKTFKIEYHTRQHDNVSLFVRYQVFNFAIQRK